jgi:hypothetical protein
MIKMDVKTVQTVIKFFIMTFVFYIAIYLILVGLFGIHTVAYPLVIGALIALIGVYLDSRRKK